MCRTAFLILIALLFSACTPIAQVAPISDMGAGTDTPTPTALWTVMPQSTVTAVLSRTPAPTRTKIPTIAPTLDPIRNTPPTLMLHRPNLKFDSLAFLKDFIALLKLNNMQVVTYRYIYEHPDITAIEKGKLFIITIDDIFLAYPIDKRVLEMIQALRDAGFPAVLGVVTETAYVDPRNAALLRELSDSGWEIATHTDNHVNLGRAEEASSKLVRNEVTISLDKIEKVTGVRPITLVLPEGNMVNNVNAIQQMGIYWIVGISDGNTYDVRDPIVYVGREGPYTNAGRTFKLMQDRFGF
ncbi:MAG: polysaccharide deacetylase family protein [Chloroflexi bacterium]|nr:polysaccharide deacetylase family protein [Chloroflexota bacterium]